jgi:hypothetical protein
MDANENTLLILGICVLSLFVIFCAGIIAVSSYFGDSEPVPEIVATPVPTMVITPVPGIIIYTSDNSTAYTSNLDGSINIVRTSDNARMWKIPVSKSNIEYLELMDNESQLFIVDANQDQFILNLTSKHIVTVTPIPEPTVVPTATPRPTQDITSMERFVVIVTPTPVPDLNRNMTINVDFNNCMDIDKSTDIKVYLKTNDVDSANVSVRLRAEYNNDTHQWEKLDSYNMIMPLSQFLKLAGSDITTLPPHSQMTKTFSPTVREFFTLFDGSQGKLYATVYRIKIDLIDNYNGQIVGSWESGRIDVMWTDEYGHRRYDW